MSRTCDNLKSFYKCDKINECFDNIRRNKDKSRSEIRNDLRYVSKYCRDDFCEATVRRRRCSAGSNPYETCLSKIRGDEKKEFRDRCDYLADANEDSGTGSADINLHDFSVFNGPKVSSFPVHEEKRNDNYYKVKRLDEFCSHARKCVRNENASENCGAVQNNFPDLKKYNRPERYKLKMGHYCVDKVNGDYKWLSFTHTNKSIERFCNKDMGNTDYWNGNDAPNQEERQNLYSELCGQSMDDEMLEQQMRELQDKIDAHQEIIEKKQDEIECYMREKDGEVVHWARERAFSGPWMCKEQPYPPWVTPSDVDGRIERAQTELTREINLQNRDESELLSLM